MPNGKGQEKNADPFSITFTVQGNTASKANSRRIVAFGGKARIIKSKRAIDFAAAMAAQCPAVTGGPYLGDVGVIIHIWYDSRRPDLDESLILDGMQGRVIGNDRQVKAKLIFWGLDRDNPRALIAVHDLPTFSTLVPHSPAAIAAPETS